MLSYLVLIASFRYEVGPDWDSYISFYRDFNKSDLLIEPGYKWLNNFYSKENIPYTVFLLSINSFSMYLIYKFLNKNCSQVFVALLIFISDSYFHFNLSGVRQAISLAIVCYAINCFIDRKYILYIILTLLASSFHISALIALLIFLIPRNSRNIYSHILKIFPMLIFSVIIFNNYPIDLLEEKITYYLSNNESATISSFLLGIIRRIIPLIIIIYFWPKFKLVQNIQFFINIYLVGLVIYLIFYWISVDVATRLSIYFLIYECIIISNIIFNIKSLTSRVIIVTFYFVVMGVKVFLINSNPTYQYQLNYII